MVETLLNVTSISPLEAGVLQLLADCLLNDYGLVGDRIADNNPPEYMLLESMGQLMEYAVAAKKKELFDRAWFNTNRYLRSSEGFFYWRLRSEDLDPDNATALIDTLRLFKALMMAADVFGEVRYIKEAEVIVGSIAKYHLEGNVLCDSYDGRTVGREKRLSLFYIDPSSLNLMARGSPILVEPCQSTLMILQQAPQNQFGFFPTWYDIANAQYRYSPQVNLVENIYTARAAQEIGIDITSFLNFLRQELYRHDRIYNYYAMINGNPAVETESTAVYALACRLFIQAGDLEAAKICYQRMLQFQIKDQHSRLRGGFGDLNSATVYAYDQLEALLTLHYGRELFIYESIK